MSYKPLMSGATMVEVEKNEYEKLIRIAERVEVISRMVAADKYVCGDDLKILLDIEERKTDE